MLSSVYTLNKFIEPNKFGISKVMILTTISNSIFIHCTIPSYNISFNTAPSIFNSPLISPFNEIISYNIIKGNNKIDTTLFNVYFLMYFTVHSFLRMAT